MNIKGLKPALLLKGDIFWLAWQEQGQPCFAMPKKLEYLHIQGMLETIGYYDIPENSALANHIRSCIESRQNGWGEEQKPF